MERKEYNGFGKLIWVYRDTAQSAYTYRPDGLRCEKIVTTLKSTILIRHIWDGQNICADANEHGIFARYIRGIGLVAREQDNLLQYYLFNAHGDVTQRTDHYGGILKSYEYDAFGVERTPEKLDSNPFRFCGEYWDTETETLYLRNRYYDPSIGRFGAEDPINDGINWYTYCGNNPIAFVDPSGLISIFVALVVSAVASFTAAASSSKATSSSSSTSSKSGSSSSSGSSKGTSSSSSVSSTNSAGKPTSSISQSSSASAKPIISNDAYAYVEVVRNAPTILRGLRDTAIFIGALLSGASTAKNATESKGDAKGKIPEAPSKQGSSEDNAQTSDGANGSITARYLRGVNLIARDQDNLLQYFIFNAHGDVVQRTDQNSTALKNYDYDAFGVEKSPEILDANSWRYCAEYFDREADTIYLRNRHYSPSTGRFLSEDPICSGLNWYTYARNNPIMFIDPLGLADVNMVDYMKAMGAEVEKYTKNGEPYARFKYGGITKTYKLNSGIMDDGKLNSIFGFESFLTDKERDTGVGIGIRNNTLYRDLITPGKDYYDIDYNGYTIRMALAENAIMVNLKTGDGGELSNDESKRLDFARWLKSIYLAQFGTEIPIDDYSVSEELIGHYQMYMSSNSIISERGRIANIGVNDIDRWIWDSAGNKQRRKETGSPLG